MSVVPNRHTLGTFLRANDETIFRVTFHDGRVFRLRRFSEIDSSIYNLPDGWTAEVEEFVSPRDEFDRRLFPAGSGVDLYESDMAEVVNEETGAAILDSPSAGANSGDAA